MRTAAFTAPIASALLALLLAAQPLHAQVAAPAAESPDASDASAAEASVPRALEPFVANYAVFDGGRALGNATLQVADQGASRWRVDLGLKGSGLMRMTGLNLQQSTVFQAFEGQYRPLSQALVKRVFLANRKTVGTYDWNAGSARWTGDIKETRRRPVPLQPGDMSGLLINLAVIRDARPGQVLRYRFVDDGRVRDHVYQVAPQTEVVQVGDLSYDAMRVERVASNTAGSERTVLWVAAGVPTPIRILQREDGQDGTDLRLIEYH